jgi:hypothetical protein
VPKSSNNLIPPMSAGNSSEYSNTFVGREAKFKTIAQKVKNKRISNEKKKYGLKKKPED